MNDDGFFSPLDLFPGSEQQLISMVSVETLPSMDIHSNEPSIHHHLLNGKWSQHMLHFYLSGTKMLYSVATIAH